MVGMLSSTEVIKRVGCSYRQLDYWCRCRVIVPSIEARGSGSGRRFNERQVRIVRLIHSLATLGAKHNVLLKAAMAADLIPWDEWFGVIYVDAEGDLASYAPASPSWAIDLAQCADPSTDPARQLVFS